MLALFQGSLKNTPSPKMGLCSSSATNDVYVDDGDPQAYEARMERIEQANEKNFLSINSFPIVKELGCGIAEVYTHREEEEEEEENSEEMTEELDGVFTLVTVVNQAKDRQLRMRTFLRKYLLGGGQEEAALRVAPFVESIRKLSSVTPNQYILTLEYAFFNRTDCILISGNYTTDLEMLMQHGFYPKESEALGIVCSVVLALQHFHQSKITVGNFLAASNVVVEKEGRSRLSLFPISVTRIGYKRKEMSPHFYDEKVKSGEKKGEEGSGSGQGEGEEGEDGEGDARSSASADGATLAGGQVDATSAGTKQQDSPQSKYRIQTKESEVRGDHNETATELKNKMGRDYLLVGRLAAQVFGIRQIENEEVMKDDTVVAKVQASAMTDSTKALIVGLLHSDQEKRWNYESIKKHLKEYDWEKFEDIKEEIYPPLCIHKELLNEINVKIMEEAKKKEEGDDLVRDNDDEENTTTKVAEDEQPNNNDEEKREQQDLQEMKVKDLSDEASEFIDHGDAEVDIESEYGDDELLPWEAAAILKDWEYNSTVLALHQLSNHIQSEKLADFASYDAEFYKPQKTGDAPQLRADLKDMGNIISKELDTKLSDK